MEDRQFKSYWFLNLLEMFASGLFIGYFRQKTADSGEVIQYKIIQSMFISSFTYLIVFFVFLKFVKTQKVWEIQNWILMAITGSIACFFTLHVAQEIFVDWQYRPGFSILGYLQNDLPYIVIGLFLLGFIYSIITLFILGTFRLPFTLLNLKRRTYP